MERNDIIRMAREAHRELVTKDYPGHAGQLDPWTMRLLERFAALVAAYERNSMNRGRCIACGNHITEGGGQIVPAPKDSNEQT